jgi:hypothetical protein
MPTIQLKISDKVYDRFLWLLSKFNKEEVEILNEDQDFISAKKYLQKELNEIKSGNAIFISQTEFESRLDQMI